MSDPSAAPPPPSSVPPGWYPDGQGGTRWWDGAQWGPPSAAPGSVPAVPAAAPATSGVQDEKTLAVLAQVLAIFTGFLGPLVIYLVARTDQPFAKHHAAEALNFQITVTIAVFVSAILIIVLVGLLLLPVVVIGALVLEIMASLAASRGEWYRFPVNLRLVPGALG
jgi:uncharacterized protein